MVGSPGYMAPEQYTGGPLDRRVDIFSAGVLLYQMLAGVLRELVSTGYNGHVVVEVQTRGLSRTERSNALAVSLNFARHHLTTTVGQIR